MGSNTRRTTRDLVSERDSLQRPKCLASDPAEDETVQQASLAHRGHEQRSNGSGRRHLHQMRGLVLMALMCVMMTLCTIVCASTSSTLRSTEGNDRTLRAPTDLQMLATNGDLERTAANSLDESAPSSSGTRSPNAASMGAQRVTDTLTSRDTPQAAAAPVGATPQVSQTLSATPSATLRTRSDASGGAVSYEKGVIICLHDGIVSMGLSLIRDLRCMGNTELIQVYHCFPNELSPESRTALLMNDTRVEIIDVCTHYVNSGQITMALAMKFRNWWIKPLALVHTAIQEVIILDADVIPLQDPANVRKLPGYVRTGTTFFYDRVINYNSFFNAAVAGRPGVNYLKQWIENFDYAAFNLTGPAPSDSLRASFAYAGKTCHEQDSSMVLVDTKRSKKALEVLWFLITRKRIEYDFSWGDKESFWLAFEFAHQEYFFSPYGVSVVSSSSNEDVKNHPDTLCGSLAHFVPIESDGDDDDEKNSPAEVLYVNGKALLNPFPMAIDALRKEKANNNWYNPNPTHVTPRQQRSPVRVSKATQYRKFPQECLVGMGSTPLSQHFQIRLLQRKLVFTALEAKMYEIAHQCPLF